MDRHLDRHFEMGLHALRNDIINMGALVESMLSDVVKALFERDASLLDVIRENEQKVDALQVKIDEECLKLTALHQPMASDLRLLFGVAKINAELERVGDHATSIGKRVKILLQYETLKPFVDMPKMFEIARTMFKESLNSFVNFDVDKARAILFQDTEVNRLRDKISDELMGMMCSQPEIVPVAMSLVLIDNLIEKIADHATNIAEVVIFVAQGKDVRHHKL